MHSILDMPRVPVSVWTSEGEVLYGQLDNGFITVGWCLGLSYGFRIGHAGKE